MMRTFLGKICSGIPIIFHSRLLGGAVKKITWRAWYITLYLGLPGQLTAFSTYLRSPNVTERPPELTCGSSIVKGNGISDGVSKVLDPKKGCGPHSKILIWYNLKHYLHKKIFQNEFQWEILVGKPPKTPLICS